MKRLMYVLISVHFFSIATSLASGKNQQCDVTLPSTQWYGESLNGTRGLYTTNSNVTIVKNTSVSFTISDFSGGIMDHFGFGGDHAIDIEIDCSGDISPTSINTQFGECKITSGSWDESTGELIIHWEIPASKVVEATKYTVN